MTATAASGLQAQMNVRATSRPQSQEALRVAHSQKESLEPESRICDGYTGFSHNLKSVRTEALSFPLPGKSGDMTRGAGRPINLVGNIQYSNAGRQGMWQVSLDGTFTSVMPERLSNGYNSAVVLNGVYHLFYKLTFSGITAWMYVTRDAKTWETVDHTGKITEATIPYALCTDGTVVYGQYYDKDAQKWKYGILNMTSLTWTAVSDCASQWNGMAYGNDKNIYAIDMAGKVLRIAPATGAATELASTGVTPYYATGATIDPSTGRMFWTVKTEAGDAYLYEINTATGAATRLAEFASKDQVCGIFVPFIAADDAPDAVTNLKAEFANGLLKGKVSFTCPTTTYGGTAASGALTYKIVANKEVVASGQTAYGADVSADVTAAKPGSITYTVFVSNEAGDGAEAKVTAFAGGAYPAAPESVTIAYQENGFNVSWPAVTKNLGGGSLDASKVTYTVTRFPGEKVVAANTSATSLNDPVTVGTDRVEYYYTVITHYDGMASEPTESNKVKLGTTALPYTEPFDNASSLSDFTIIDVNNDKKTWQHSTDEGGTLRIQWNKEMNMDDWAITPQFMLQAGKKYKVSFGVKTKSFAERIEVKAGNAPTVENMTITVIEPKEYKSSDKFTDVEGTFSVPTSGMYYIGLHGCSDKDRYYLYVDNLHIEEALEADVPAKVTDLTVTPAADGSNKAVVAGKAPLTTVGGTTLASISKIEIKRDNVLVHTVSDIAPGAKFSWNDDAIPAAGEHTWEVTAFNDKGSGEAASAKAYIGYNKPAAPTNVSMTETQNGKVHVAWNAVTTDANGLTLPAGSVKYRVVDAGDVTKVYQDNISGTEADFTALTSGQDFVQVAVFAFNEGGVSEGAAGPFMAVGVPYTLPYSESFAGASLKYILGAQKMSGNGATWNLQKDGGLGIHSVDGDNGFISGKFTALNDAGMIFTGKIDLASANNPSFSFYTYNITNGTNPDINELDVKIREVGTDAWTVLKHGTVNDLCNGDTSVWRQIKVGLDAYKGKKVQIGIQGTCKYYVYVMIDKIQVGENLAHNLGVSEITAPQSIKPNVEFMVNTEVENRGANTESDYTVEFYRGDASEPFKTVNGVSVAPGAKTIFSAPVTLGFTDADATVNLHAVVKCSADMDNSDNTSKSVTVTRVYSRKPAPTGLISNSNHNAIELNWVAPDLNASTGETRDLEDLPAWENQDVDGWSFVDVDKKPRGGFQGLEIPNNALKSLGSFFVFQQGGDFNTSYAAHSGNKFFASLFNYDASQVDDWLISPQLDGTKQTVRFWARSYSTSYLESMEILYSTSDKNTTNFTSVKAVPSVPGSWTEYSFEVPAGAKYFAVRNNGIDKFMLMLDDFTFRVAPEKVVGYNVYRDGVRLNTQPVTSTTYIDQAPLEGSHRYDVTAVYSDGDESAPVSASVNKSVEALENGVSVTAGHGFIAIDGAEGRLVKIDGINGVQVFSGMAEGSLRIEVASGIYIVRVENGTIKVIVK